MGNSMSEQQQRENKMYGYGVVDYHNMYNYSIISNKVIGMSFDNSNIVISRKKINFPDPNFPTLINIQNTYVFEFKNHTYEMTQDYNRQLTDILNFYEKNDKRVKNVQKKHFSEGKIMIEDINSLNLFIENREKFTSGLPIEVRFKVKIHIRASQPEMRLILDSVFQRKEKIAVVQAVKIEIPSCPEEGSEFRLVEAIPFEPEKEKLSENRDIADSSYTRYNNW